jgi:hypothetical protein
VVSLFAPFFAISFLLLGNIPNVIVRFKRFEPAEQSTSIKPSQKSFLEGGKSIYQAF